MLFKSPADVLKQKLNKSAKLFSEAKTSCREVAEHARKASDDLEIKREEFAQQQLLFKQMETLANSNLELIPDLKVME